MFSVVRITLRTNVNGSRISFVNTPFVNAFSNAAYGAQRTRTQSAACSSNRSFVRASSGLTAFVGTTRTVFPHDVRRYSSSSRLDATAEEEATPTRKERRAKKYGDGSLDAAAEEETTPSKTTINTNTSAKTSKLVDLLPTVMIQRNRQSMSFREGNPLVFSGAISYTYQTTAANTEQTPIESDDDDTSSGLALGTLVQVAVSPEKQSPLSSNKRKKPAKRNKRNSNSNSKEAEIRYPHYTDEIVSKGNQDDAEREELLQTELQSSQSIGIGIYNPHSMYRVRILWHTAVNTQLSSMLATSASPESSPSPTDILRQILTLRFQSAVQTRSKGLKLPNSDTNSYRLVNGEGDGLSGLAVDVLGGSVAVVMSSAAWCEIYKDLIVETLDSVLNDNPASVSDDDTENVRMDIVWRNTPARLKQDGYLTGGPPAFDDNSPDAEDRRRILEHEAQLYQHRRDECVIATESKIQYRTYPYNPDNQKTGFYCDQRENRVRLASLLDTNTNTNTNVLDLCCYHGGFALHCAKAGATVTAVDSSRDAIDTARSNADLNNCADRITFVNSDIETFLKDERTRADGLEHTQQQPPDVDDEASASFTGYDVIILDPPKLAPSLSSLPRATRKYHSLNTAALNLIHPQNGGLLLSCTCSAAMTQAEGGRQFQRMLQTAAVSARRSVKVLEVWGASGCHVRNPAAFPAGEYLTAVLLFVGPKMD